MKKKILITLLVITGLFATNVLYWTLSDVQQECYLKIKNNKELNFYEKASIYSLNLCICAFGWPLSPEATIQQILCTVPTEDTIILHSDHFSNHEKIWGLIKKYPNATVHRPAKVVGLQRYVFV